MSIIIFLEENVREPGGLYGNIEYIRFSRENPQASFDKLLQMLLSLSPKEPVGSTANAEPPPSEKTRLAEEAPTGLDPKPDWDSEQYERAIARAIFQGDEVTLNRIAEAFHALSCCRFSGRLVKLIPPCVRTQQG
jgi:hypothetical protein